MRYEIRERLVADGGEASAAEGMAKRFALLAAGMEKYEAEDVSLRVSTPSGGCTCEGENERETLLEAARLLHEAAANRLPAEAALYLGCDFGDENDPAAPLPYLRALGALPENAAGNTRYSLYVCGEGGETMGAVYFFGRDSRGVFRHGERACFSPVGALPENACWITNTTPLYIGSVADEALYEACRRLSLAAGNEYPEGGVDEETGFRYYPDLFRCRDGTAEYALMNVILPDNEAVAAFSDCLARVLRLAGLGKMEMELTSCNFDDPRLLRLSVSPDGTRSFWMTDY